MQELHLTITGEVHGVGFRYHTKQQAQELRLKGFVQNLPDGSVEILAQGERQNLEKLFAWAKEGPKFAQVASVKQDWRKPTQSYSDFQII